MWVTARREQSGFTLVELLVVIVILGLISAGSTVAIGRFTGATAGAACAVDAKSLSGAQDVAFRANGEYSSQDELIAARYLHGPVGSYTISPEDPIESYTLVPNAQCADRAPTGVSNPGPPHTLPGDLSLPTVLSINRSDPSPTSAASVSWVVTFSEAVSGVGLPRFELANSGLGAPAFSGITGGGATYSVTATTGSGSGSLGLNLVSAGAIADAAGNALSETFPVDGASYVIDRTPPIVTGVSSPLANGSYATGQVVPVTVTFSEPVTVTGTPRLTLSTGSPATTAVDYTSGSGTATMTFDYAVVAGNTSTDLNYTSTNSLALNGGTIRDAATNNATLALPAITAANSLGGGKEIVIDGVAPLVTLMVPENNSSASDTTPALSGAASSGESPTVVVKIYNGAGTGGAVVQMINVTRSIASWSTTAAALADGKYTAQATQSDLVGNVGSSTANTFTVDTTPPTVLNVSSPLANGSYKVAQVVPVTVTFSEPVTVTGTPRLTLSTGSPATTAVNYFSGSGTATLTFNYTVVAGNNSPDLDYAATSSLALNTGTIRDIATNNATLTLPVPSATGSLGANKAIVVDTTKPRPTALALSNGGTLGTVDAGDTVTITYSEPLKVSSLCSTWNGDSSNQSLSDATVTITDGGGPDDDVISSVTSPTCTFNLGSVGLGSKFWLSNTRTFGATATKSTVQWNATARTLTITLGTPSGSVGSVGSNVTPVYTPVVAITDPAVNTIVTTAFNGTSSRF